MQPRDTVWKSETLSDVYLSGIRGAIPLATEQIDIMLRLARAACPSARSILDLGCGDGILGHAVLNQYPEARAVFVDFSEPMLAAARERVDGDPRAVCLWADYGQKEWREQLSNAGYGGGRRFDIIVSGFSIHHQPDLRKRELYQELFDLLEPGGLFLNLEHVSSPTRWLELRFEELFIDHLVSYQRSIGSSKPREEIEKEFYYRPDKAANVLAPVDAQCNWLREIGFAEVDCYLKIYELALFGGIKPTAARSDLPSS